MSSSYSNYEQTIVLNGYALSGVQSVDGSYGIAEKPVRVAGVGFIDALIDSPLQGNFSINRTMVSADPMLETDSIGKYKFDEDEISGAILYNNSTKGFGFNQARLNRYSVSCTVGQLPEIQTDFTVYGELGKNVFPGFEYFVNENFEHHPFTGYVFYAYQDLNFSDFFNVNITSEEPSYSDTHSIYLKDALDLTHKFGDWYESEWFIRSKINSSSDAFIDADLNYIQGGEIDEVTQGWFYMGKLGFVNLSTTNQPIKAVWLSKIIKDSNGNESVMFLHFSDNATPHGMAYLNTNNTSLTGPNGWIAFFPDPDNDYGIIYYNTTDANWYGVKRDGTTHKFNLFAGGRNILAGNNLNNSWNDSSLKVGYQKFSELQDTSILSEDGSVLYLGQNAFSKDSDYSAIIYKTHPPIRFTDQASMTVNVSDFSIDAISDFSFTRTLNLTPVYALPRGTEADWVAGSKPSVPNLQPVQVDTQYPIETDINFTMIANEYEIREIKDRIQSAPKSTVSIEIRDGQTKEMINAYTGHNVRLIGESINSSIEGEMSISLTYKGYDTLHNPVS
jgi:hypothetical protein